MRQILRGRVHAPVLLAALALVAPRPGTASEAESHQPAADPPAVAAPATPETAPGGEPPPAPLAPSDDPSEDPLFGDSPDVEVIEPDVDPWEPFNRAVFSVNRQLNRFVFFPIADGYQFVMPEPGQDAIHRAFLNINSTAVLANDLLQLRFKRAGVTGLRFVLNTTIGFVGLLDAAKHWGLERHHADFGQTLALMGVGSGPYLVMPILGPTTVRDGVGTIVDRAFMPLTYVLGPISPTTQLISNIVMGTGMGFTTLEENEDDLRELEKASVDFYAALRSAYLQQRHAQIWGSTPAAERPPPPVQEAGAARAHVVPPPLTAYASAY